MKPPLLLFIAYLPFAVCVWSIFQVSPVTVKLPSLQIVSFSNRLMVKVYNAQKEIGGNFPFGIQCAKEVIKNGARNGMTLAQYFDKTLN